MIKLQANMMNLENDCDILVDIENLISDVEAITFHLIWMIFTFDQIGIQYT